MADKLGLGMRLAEPFVNNFGLGMCEYRNDQTSSSATFTDAQSPYLESLPGKTASAFVKGLRASYPGATVPSGLGPDAWESWQPSSSGTAADVIAWTKDGHAFVLQVNARQGSDLHEDRVEAAARMSFDAFH